ncbi:MAG: M48 family metallopeptidase [Verrucomicrobiota bacterium]
MNGFDAVLFDGRSARPHPVRARFTAGGGLELTGPDGAVETFGPAEVQVTARLGRAPRLIQLPGDRHCETEDNEAVDAALAALGRECGAAWLHRLENNWRAVVAGLVVVSAATWVAVRHGLPAAAESIARKLPIEVNEQIGGDALRTLDRLVFTPSDFSSARQAELRRQFAELLAKNGDPYPYRLEFRSAKKLGPNALAFPSGVIVVTDELVELAEDDRQILAVLAHECGHIQGRHGLRTVLQNSAVVILFALLTGDVSSVSALGGALPTLLLESKFSRTFEEEADAHAVAVLRRAGLAPDHLADILRRLEEKRPKTGLETKVLDYVSSHPPTPERIQWIRGR